MFIELKNAVKTYGKGDTKVNALNGLSFQLEEGKICVILGPSGSGKSTLLNILGGLDYLDEGVLKVDGKTVTSLTKNQLTDYRKDDIGFVFQFYNLIPDLTAEENIEVVSDIAERPLDLEELLDSLEITHLRKRFPAELSGGQQQRVAIARAMIKRPKLLLCDELTGALDTHSSRAVLEVIEKVNAAYGTTIAIVTHNEAFAAMADCVVRIKDGEVDEFIENQTKVPAKDLDLTQQAIQKKHQSESFVLYRCNGADHCGAVHVLLVQHNGKRDQPVLGQVLCRQQHRGRRVHDV